MRKHDFSICENKRADQLHSNCAADQRLCFATLIVQPLFFLNPIFPTSSRLLWLYNPVCVGPGQKPEDRFCRDAAQFAIAVALAAALLLPVHRS